MQEWPAMNRHLPTMLELDSDPTGRHFLQIPGPSPVPDRVLRAMSLPTIDHRGPEFAQLGKRVLAGLQQVFQTRRDLQAARLAVAPPPPPPAADDEAPA